MKKFILSSFLFLLVTGCSSMRISSGIKLPSYDEYTLKNGLKIIAIEDHSLPYINVGLLVRSGASQDPAAKSGLAEMTAQLLERGSKLHSANELADSFGALGTAFSAGTDYDQSYFETSGLSQHQEKLLDLFFEVVTTPSFSVSEIDRMRSEFIAGIKRNYDQPRYVAGLAFNQMLFGAHPYGRSSSGTVRDLKGLKQKDIIRFYLKHYRPNNATLVLVGDLNSNIIKYLEKTLASWESRPVELEKLPEQAPLSGRRLLLVHRGDLQQTEVRLGHYGVQRKIDDYLALQLADSILSEGFTSRLMNEIREKRGLTYGIQSGFDARKEVGPFIISTNTRNEKAGEIVSETIKTVEEFYSKGVTKEEVEAAKGYMRGAFPRRIETPDKMAQMLVALRFYGVDDSYLKNYIKNLNAISVDDVNRVIKKYYHPEQFQVVVYAPKDKALPQLRKLGMVIDVKNYTELF